MSLALLSDALRALASDDTPPCVVALRGHWGTGKTYLWRHLVEQEKPSNYVYLSAFGLESLVDLRDAAVAGAITHKMGEKAPAGKIKAIVNAIRNAPQVEAFASIGSQFLFEASRGHLICIDDIERRGDGLSLKAILGFATRLRDENHCHVLLILNEDAMSTEDQSLLNDYRDKVLDAAYWLDPSAEDVADLPGVLPEDLPRREDVRQALIELNVRNIRVATQTARLIRNLAPPLEAARDDVAVQIIRTAVYLNEAYFDTRRTRGRFELIAESESLISLYMPDAFKERQDPVEQQQDEWLTKASRFVSDMDSGLRALIAHAIISGVPNLTSLHIWVDDQNARQNQRERYRILNGIRRTFYDDLRLPEIKAFKLLQQALFENLDLLVIEAIDSHIVTFNEMGRPDMAKSLKSAYLTYIDAGNPIQRESEHSTIRDPQLAGLVSARPTIAFSLSPEEAAERVASRQIDPEERRQIKAYVGTRDDVFLDAFTATLLVINQIEVKDAIVNAARSEVPEIRNYADQVKASLARYFVQDRRRATIIRKQLDWSPPSEDPE